MKQKKILRLICSVLSFLFLVLALPLSVFAGSVVEIIDIDESEAMKDLQTIGIDITKYPKDVEAEHCRILYFLEYGFDYYGRATDYGLYVYLYNPTGKEIDLNESKSIQIQALKADVDVVSGWEKYPLEYISHSTTEGYEHVFYKFKIVNAHKLLGNLSRDLRHYDISGIEVTFKGNYTATDFKVGGRYSFHGYMAYYNKDRTALNNLYMNVNDIITVDLKLTPVSWKTKTSDKGAGYQYEVTSVYFAVPNDIINDYGDKNDETKGLVEVKTYFDEYKMNGIVTSNTELYSIVYNHLGEGSSDKIPFGVQAGGFYNSAIDNIEGAFTYNSQKYFQLGCRNEIKRSFISTVFRYSEDDFQGISSSEFEKGFYDILNDKQSVRFLSVPFMGYKTIEAGQDLSDNIATYASVNQSKFLAWLKGEGKLYIEDEIYDNIQSIQAVDKSDLLVGDFLKTDAAIASEYYMQESEVDAFADFVSDSKFATPYLLRFAVRDYFFGNAYVAVDGFGNDVHPSEGTYYFEKNIFLNFDIISLTYENQYGQRTVIPVVSSPLNVFGSVTDTPLQEPSFLEKTIDSVADFWKALLTFFKTFKPVIVIIVVLIVLALLAWILSKIWSGVSAPFKAFSKARDQRNEQQQKQKQQKREEEEHEWKRKKYNQEQDEYFSSKFGVRGESTEPINKKSKGSLHGKTKDE